MRKICFVGLVLIAFALLVRPNPMHSQASGNNAGGNNGDDSQGMPLRYSQPFHPTVAKAAEPDYFAYEDGTIVGIVKNYSDHEGHFVASLVKVSIGIGKKIPREAVAAYHVSVGDAVRLVHITHQFSDSRLISEDTAASEQRNSIVIPIRIPSSLVGFKSVSASNTLAAASN